MTSSEPSGENEKAGIEKRLLRRMLFPSTVQGWLWFGLIGVPAAFGAAVVALVTRNRELQVRLLLHINHRARRREEQLGNWSFVLFAVLAIGLALVVVYVEELDAAFASRSFQILAFVGAIVAAFFLYYLRDHGPALYAVLELSVAVVTLVAAVATESDDTIGRGLKYAAGIYLFVRGLDNLNTGPERARKAAERMRESNERWRRINEATDAHVEAALAAIEEEDREKRARRESNDR